MRITRAQQAWFSILCQSARLFQEAEKIAKEQQQREAAEKSKADQEASKLAKLEAAEKLKADKEAERLAKQEAADKAPWQQCSPNALRGRASNGLVRTASALFGIHEPALFRESLF